MRLLLLACLLAVPGLPWAQNTNMNVSEPAPNMGVLLSENEQSQDTPAGQRVERLHHEDTGAVIDEVRRGGQSQSIAVQPRANVPGYEISPTDLARSRPADHRDGLGAARGTRMWNLLRF